MIYICLMHPCIHSFHCHGHGGILTIASQIHGPPAERHTGDFAQLLDTSRKEDLDHGVINSPCVHRLFRTGFIHGSLLKPDVDLVIRPQNMCTSSFRCVCIPGVSSEVIRIAVHMPVKQIAFDRILRPEEFPRFCRLEICVPDGILGDDMHQCEGVWRLVAVPSLVEDLTVDFMMGSHTCAVTQLAAALMNPGTALRHVTLRGTPSSTWLPHLICTLVAVSSQLETLCLVELDPFLHNALDDESTDQVMLACKQLQFSSFRFIPTDYNTSELLVAWDRLFGDPRLRRIVVSNLRSSCEWPSTWTTMDPPVLVPGRRVIIKLQDQTWWNVNDSHWDAFQLLKQIAATATEVEFHIHPDCPYVYCFLGMIDQPSNAWTHATLHLTVLFWCMIPADSSVKTITQYLDFIAPTCVQCMNAQRNHNMVTQMKVYAHLDDDVLPNITNEDLATLLQNALQLWNNEQHGAVRLWLQSHDILRLVRGPLTPLE